MMHKIRKSRIRQKICLTRAFFCGILSELVIQGEMAERLMALVLKTSDAERHRGFESLSLRQHSLSMDAWHSSILCRCTQVAQGAPLLRE